MPYNDDTQDQPMPHSYEIVREIANLEKEGSTQKLTLVKLSKPQIARGVGSTDYFDVEYVLIGSAKLTKEDKFGTFVYEETAITASDKDATEHKAYLYFAKRALSVEEALFSIGEF